MTGSRRERRRRRTGTQSGNESSNAPLVDRLSEDEFYRVAVEKILEEDSKAASTTEEVWRDRDDHVLSTMTSPRLERPGSKEGGARDSSRLRDQTRGYDGSNLQDGKCSTYASRGCSRRDRVEGQVRRRRGSDVRRATIRQSKTYSDEPALARPKAREGNCSRKLSPSEGPRRVGYGDSLLSLFEAQSVEHYAKDSDCFQAAIGGCVGGSDSVERESMERSSVQKDISARHSLGRGETCNVERQHQEIVRETRDIVLGEYPWSEGKASWSQGSGMGEIVNGELKEGPAEVELPREVAESGRWERRQRLAEAKVPRRTETTGQEDDAGIGDDIFCGKPSRSTQGECKPQHAIIRQQPRTSSHAIIPDEGSWDDDLGNDIIVRREERWHRPSCPAPYFTVHQDYLGSDAAAGIVESSTQWRQMSRPNAVTSKITVNMDGLDYIGQGDRRQISGIGQGVSAGKSVTLDSPRSMCHVDSIIEEGDVTPFSFGRLGQPFFDTVTSSADKASEQNVRLQSDNT